VDVLNHKKIVTVMSNIINRVNATRSVQFPKNQEVSMNADGSGGPVSFNKDAKFMTSMYGGMSGGTTEKHKEIEKSETRSGYEKFSDYGHVGLDALGMIPIFGAVADGINAAWYAGEGDYTNAAFSAAAAIPGAGQYATAGKYAMKGFKGASKPIIKYAKNNKIMTGLDVGLGGLNLKNGVEEIANTDYNKTTVQGDLDNSREAVLESERKGDEAINDPMSSGKTKSWSKGYGDYKAKGGKGDMQKFKDESNAWWNTTAGQKYAKDKNIKHRITSSNKQRYMGGVASSNRQGLNSYKK